MFKSYKLYVGLEIDTRSPLIGQPFKGRLGEVLVDCLDAGLASIFFPLLILNVYVFYINAQFIVV